MSSDSADESSSEHKSSTVCFLCRRRKTKCDRTLPQCGFCIKAKIDCQYVPKPQKRGLRAGYVSELESRIDHLENEVGILKHERTVVPFQTPASQTPHNGTAGTPASMSASAFTPSPNLETSSKRRRLGVESDAAVRDLYTLPHTFLSTLGELWFKETQPWLPILSYQHIQDALQALPDPVDHIDDIELRAVLSLQIAYSTQAIVLGYHGRQRLSQHLRSQVLTEAIAKPSLSSIRALIIIAFLDYGNDNITSVFSLLSVCRRTAEHLGLFRKLLQLIEHESPTQVGPPSRPSSDGDALSRIAVTWATLGLDAVSTLGVPWRDVSAALVDHLASVAYVSTPDLRDSWKSHVHLCAIGLQPVHNFIHEFAGGLHDPTSDETLTKCDEMYSNLVSYVQAQPATSYTLLADGAIDFDPCLAHTGVLANVAVIMIYQMLIDFSTMSPAIAISRCHQACEALVLTIRNISDADAELNSPFLGHFFFVAARFKVNVSRALSQPREASFDTLMHGINMSGRRWPVARRLDIVLRAAITELDSGTSTGLPDDFWNLKRSHLDISEELKEWVAQHKPDLYVGSLNGPYV